MYTLNYIKQLIEAYAQSLSELEAHTKEEYGRLKDKEKKHFQYLFEALRDSNPALLQLNFNDHLDKESIELIINRIIQNASNTYSAPFLPTGNTVLDFVEQDSFLTPTFVKWQYQGYKKQNFVISYNNELFSLAHTQLTKLMTNMLLPFYPGKIHFNIFDPGMTGLADELTVGFDSEIYNNIIITEDSDATACIRRLRERMQLVMQNYGDVIRYNELNKTIAIPYEVVVLCNYPEGFERHTNQMLPLFENGYKGGISFIVMHNSSAKPLDERTPDLLQSDNKTIIPLQKEDQTSDSIVYSTPITSHYQVAEAYRRIFHQALHPGQKEFTNKVDIHEMSASPYLQTVSSIKAPIGINSEGETIDFKVDINQGHYHAFIIGETGSGKSRFLHDIIISLITKYSPEDIELYLMDFKGVEFNDYRNIKHSRVILVDRADERITYEVIRELKEKMEIRQRELASAGASDVDEYNRKMKDKHLSQIVLVADECQTLFIDNSRHSRLQREMIEIIALIAQQGRAYGVHLLLSTQSLSNAPLLGKDILNQIGEHYILPCLPADARRLVPDHEQRDTEQIVSKMVKGKGQCYYQGADGKYLFTFNFIKKGEEQTHLIELARDKAKNATSNGQVYFSGSLQYEMTRDTIKDLASKGRKNIVASPGQIIAISQNPCTIPLRSEQGENILLLGINDKHYVTRTTMDVLMSLIYTNKYKELGYEFVVIDCTKNNEEEDYLDILDFLSSNSLCRVIKSSQRKNELYQLCKNIAQGQGRKTILTILGVETFRELKYDEELDLGDEGSAKEETTPTGWDDLLTNMNSLSNPIVNSTSQEEEDISKIKTVSQALDYILEKGPEKDIHTVMQIDRADNFYISNQGGYLDSKSIYRKFSHLILLRSNEKDIPMLKLPDDIRPELFEDNAERLRAYYYNEGNNTFSLFTPYMMPSIEQINKILNN